MRCKGKRIFENHQKASQVCIFATSKHVLEGGMVEQKLPEPASSLRIGTSAPTKGRRGLLAASYTILKCS